MLLSLRSKALELFGLNFICRRFRETAFPAVASAQDAKPVSRGTAGKTVNQNWPDLAAGGRPAYTTSCDWRL